MRARLRALLTSISRVLLLPALLTLWPCEGAATQEWLTGMSLQLSRDDNLVFSQRDPKRDWIFEMRPSLSWRYRTERDAVDVTAELRGQKFSTEDDLDTLNQDYRLYASRVFSDTTASLNGRYTLDTTLDEEFTEEGIVLFRQDRRVYSLAPAMEWRVTERSRWGLSIPVYHVNYVDDTLHDHGIDPSAGNNVDYGVDYGTLYVTIDYSYLLDDELTTLFSQLSTGSIDFENGGSRIFEILGGVGRAFTERLSGKLMAGLNHTRSHTDVLDPYPVARTVEETSENLGWVGLAEVRWSWDRGYWNLNLSRSVSASGYGETLIRNRLGTEANQALTGRLRLTGRLGVGSVESFGDARERDYVTYDIGPGLVYRLSERIDLGAYYRYSLLDDREASTTTSRNLFVVRLDFKDFRL